MKSHEFWFCAWYFHPGVTKNNVNISQLSREPVRIAYLIQVCRQIEYIYIYYIIYIILYILYYIYIILYILYYIILYILYYIYIYHILPSTVIKQKNLTYLNISA